jgi:hypothetical protein
MHVKPGQNLTRDSSKGLGVIRRSVLGRSASGLWQVDHPVAFADKYAAT